MVCKRWSPPPGQHPVPYRRGLVVGAPPPPPPAAAAAAAAEAETAAAYVEHHDFGYPIDLSSAAVLVPWSQHRESVPKVLSHYAASHQCWHHAVGAVGAAEGAVARAAVRRYAKHCLAEPEARAKHALLPSAGRK